MTETEETPPPTVPALFAERVARTPEAVAYRSHDAKAGAWVALSWAEMDARAADWRRAFAREGLAPGERVAIRLANGPDWVAFDLAALSLGLVVVPLFVGDAAATAARIIEDCGARLLLLETRAEWEALESAGAPRPARVLCRRATGDGPSLAGLDAWLDAARGDPLPAERTAAPGALATIVYTSGTTGAPKGVMLSHETMLSVALAILERAPGTARDVFFSYLPLGHIFERVVGYYVPMAIGATVVHARSVETLRADIARARPTILLVVPSLLERARAAALERAARTPLLGRLLAAAVRAGLALHAERREGRRAGPLLRWRAGLLRRLAGRRVLAALGGRVRLAVSGGAPLPVEVAEFFLGLGLPLVEGYGLTEASSAATSAWLGRYAPGRAGPPLNGARLRIGAGGELLLRSPGVMLGYWNAPELTRETFCEGWLRTGDVARIEDGELRIVGRLKELIVLSKGENVAPAPVEAAITADPLFRQALVVGEGWAQTGAVLVLEPAAWARFAREQGIDPAAADALAHPRAVEAAQARVARLTDGFPTHARPRAVALTLEDWTVEAGLLTPTRKLRRAALADHLAQTIARLGAAVAARRAG